jgi:hypothetical protein
MFMTAWPRPCNGAAPASLLRNSRYRRTEPAEVPYARTFVAICNPKELNHLHSLLRLCNPYDYNIRYF